MGVGYAYLLEDELVKGIADILELDLRWNRFAKSTLQHERKLKPKLRAVFEKQKQDVLKRVSKNPPPEKSGAMAPEQRIAKAPSDVYESWLFKKEEWAFFLEQAAKPHVEAAMIEGAEVAGRDISRALDVSMAIDLDVSDPRIAGLINEKLHKFSFEVNEETTRLLKKEFTEAVTEGEGIPLIRKRVEKVFGFTKRVRTERIARTEIIGTYNRGYYEGMVESGVVEKKTWLETRDSKTREQHNRNTGVGGESVPVKDNFSNGLLHPGDWNGPASEIVN